MVKKKQDAQPNNHKHLDDIAFIAYIEGSLSEKVKNKIRAAIKECKYCHSKYALTVKEYNLMKRIEEVSASGFPDEDNLSTLCDHYNGPI